jgi:hypothetical protein
VAVLLNDGAGNFAAADPTQFQINSVHPKHKSESCQGSRRTARFFPSSIRL